MLMLLLLHFMMLFIVACITTCRIYLNHVAIAYEWTNCRIVSNRIALFGGALLPNRQKMDQRENRGTLVEFMNVIDADDGWWCALPQPGKIIDNEFGCSLPSASKALSIIKQWKCFGQSVGA